MVSNIDQFLTAKSNAVAVHESCIPASDYFSVLSSSTRVHILKILAAGAKDCHTISREIQVSYVGAMKHLKKLLDVGLIRKTVGVGRETSKGVHPVFLYSLADENHFERTLSEQIRAGLDHGNDKSNDVLLVREHVPRYIPPDSFDDHFQSGGEL